MAEGIFLSVVGFGLVFLLYVLVQFRREQMHSKRKTKHELVPISQRPGARAAEIAGGVPLITTEHDEHHK